MNAGAARRHAIVVADGDMPERSVLDAAWPGWDLDAEIVVAADGGARAAEALGLAIDLVVGDGDSLGDADVARLRAAGVEVRLARVDKDETDTELALVAAVARGASRITLVGALGGPRVDHELANVALLAHPVLANTDAAIVDPRGRISLLVAPGADGEAVSRSLPGPAGRIVSLLGLDGEVRGVTTQAFRYPLANEALPLGPARGLSNVVVGPHATVTVASGRLLIVEAPPEQAVGGLSAEPPATLGR